MKSWQKVRQRRNMAATVHSKKKSWKQIGTKAIIAANSILCLEQPKLDNALRGKSTQKA